MKNRWAILLVLCLLAACARGQAETASADFVLTLREGEMARCVCECGTPQPTETPSPTDVPTAIPTATAEPTETPVPTATSVPGEIIVDNAGAGFSVAWTQDEWVEWSGESAQLYGNSHHYNRAIGTGQDVATWTFDVPQPGQYEVYAWWFSSDWRPTDVPYTIYHATGAATVRVNQQAEGGRWNYLAAVQFDASGSVSVSDDVSSGRGIIADAIRLVYLGPPTTPDATATSGPTSTPLPTNTPQPTPTDPPSGQAWRPFSDNSPWNTPLGDNPRIDPRSDAHIAQMNVTQPGVRVGIAIDEWTIPVYFVEDLQPYPPMLRVPAHSGWGFTLSAPIPRTARPDPSADAHLCIVDRSTGQSWDYWEIRGSYPNLTSGTGRAISTTGSGVRPAGSHGCREAGFPLIAGLVRPEEIEAGIIRHALVYAFDARNGYEEFVPPASTGADNHGSGSRDVLPMGARLQLKPGVDISGFPRGARIAAQAMKDYGMYLGDENDFGSLGVYFENNSTANWGALFGSADRSALSGLRASDFRVIALSPGSTPQPTAQPTATPRPTTTPQAGAAQVFDHRHVDASQLSAAEIQRAAQRVTFFNHKSVGVNILDHIGYWGSIGVRRSTGNQPGINEYEGGSNADYAAKIASFEAVSHSGHDIAMQKFCFVEFPPWQATTGREVFNAYRAMMDRMEARYPGTTFVWWTAPVHTNTSGPRSEFNRLVRAHVQANGGVLFDIGDIESDGGRCGEDNMCAAYTNDGGHLNATGARRAAGAFWVMLANVE